MTIGLSGVLSAFLVNDVVCVALTPGAPPLPAAEAAADPALVGLATAANIGSVATITGNPQNIITARSRVSPTCVVRAAGPVALFGLILNFAVVAMVYRRRSAWWVRGCPRPTSRTGRGSIDPSSSRVSR
ncbi:MAG: SLC13 family permease [Singulisphaera sp.]